jgi:phosphotransferase system  glucose/maltose/N-acetylglucosamine-specific IIC component
MKEFFEAIQSLFMDVLLAPLTYIRLEIQPDSWLMANAINFVFVIIGFVFFFYWMKQLKIFSQTENTKDDDEVFLI